MSNSEQFAIEIDQAFDKLLEEQFLPFKQKIAMQALTGVTLKMPVLTGRARGNTFVSVGYLSEDLVGGEDTTGGVTLSAGQAEILADRDPFSPVYIQNNLPYIRRLEYGWSKQAPLGMFAVTVAEIETQFR